LKQQKNVQVIGAGLAGSEAAWQLAERGLKVTLFEMRPVKSTPAHVTGEFAELVCSNSLGSDLPDRAGGLLKHELRQLKSLILECADATRVPAGGALAVGRREFSSLVTKKLSEHPNITIVREEVKDVPVGPTVVASGPLTSNSLAESISALIGSEYLYFYDALSPIVTRESIDMNFAFRASRYGRGDEESGDYINCPFDEGEYRDFIRALIAAERIDLREFEIESAQYFEGCLPIEVLASRGELALSYGPLRPVGLRDPRTDRRPFAVLQLRMDDAAGDLYNLVGFQSNLKWPEQKRVLRMIPGLANADFVRLGQMHRNTFLNSPILLLPTMQARCRSDLFFAGQITGIEGYVGNAASGLLAAINLANFINEGSQIEFPHETMIGALAHYITSAEPKHFQPIKAAFGILPELENPKRDKRERYLQYVNRAEASLAQALSILSI
jgi:methylenetetrahydrofolate--tRNA-(uracil-5-)-methyltransferase